MVTQLAHVLVVEDDGPIRSALDLALRAEGYQVLAAADGTDIAEVVASFHPDIALLDVRLPVGPGGLELARSIREVSDIPVLFLTAADALEDRLAGFEAGADDYLVKPFSMAEVLVRVKALLRRSGRLASSVWQLADMVVDEGARTVTRSDAGIDLTRIEFELLSALAKHPGRVLSKVQLLAQVWGFDAVDTNLVEVHVSALRRKLEANGDRLVHTVRGSGYVLRA